MPLEFEEPKTDAAMNSAPPLKYTDPGREAAINTPSESPALVSDCRALSVAARQRRASYLRWQAGLSVLGVGLVAILTLMRALPHAASTAAYGILFTILVVASVCIGGYVRLTRRNKQLRTLIQAVISADDTASTGALVDVLGVDDVWAAREARRHLKRLAPRWTEADLADLTPDQRDGLRSIVDGGQTRLHGDASGSTAGQRYAVDRAELRSELCNALGRLGDDKDHQALLRTALLPAISPANRRVRDAARAAVSILDARLAAQHRSRTLLRASDAPATSPAELVRAAESPSATPPEQLLRPR